MNASRMRWNYVENQRFQRDGVFRWAETIIFLLQSGLFLDLDHTRAMAETNGAHSAINRVLILGVCAALSFE